MATRRDFLRTMGLGAAALAAPGCGTAVDESDPTRVVRAQEKPNVIFVLTDDQGYGDLACHGNRLIRTPHQDLLHSESVRFTNFHVSPCCSPTRAQLMTGRYSNRTGVWHTVQGRSLLHRDEVTMADVFKTGGYSTAIFGKWHLGDNFPCRPQDRGFDEVLVHGGGGVGNIPDYWGNDYFDDTYFRNGTPEKFEGYCTDVWFTEAMKFIERNRDRPFFCYIPTNAPHLPFVAPEKYIELYRGSVRRPALAGFYAMITNIDDNMARLRDKLRELGIERNTILVFITDNGSSCGAREWNAGMRGSKGSEWDGGHRVPFFIHWPGGGLTGGRDIDALAAGIDLLPTLMELCGLARPGGPALDGRSLVPLVKGRTEDWPDRTLFVDNQRTTIPQRWRRTAVMTDRWRLVDNRELHDIKADPGQKRNLIGGHPGVAARLRAEYDRWWEGLAESRRRDYPVSIGSDAENPAVITTHDIIGVDIWNQDQVLAARPASGYWVLNVERAGDYEFSLRRYPKEADAPITAAAPVPPGLKELNYFARSLDYAMRHDAGRAVPATFASLKVGSFSERKPVPRKTEGSSPDYETVGDGEVTAVNFRVRLPAGKTRMEAWFGGGGEAARGGYRRIERAKYGGGVALGGGHIRASGLGKHDELTLAMWVKLNGLPRAQNALLHSEGWAASGLHVLFREDGRLNFCVNGCDPVNQGFVSAAGRRLVGRWAHVATVYDAPAKTIAVYVDGRKRGAMRYTRTIPVDLDAPFRIGGWDREDRALDGSVDDIRVYSQALTGDEVELARKNRPVGKKLSAWWKLDEATGDSAMDSSGNKHTAKLSTGGGPGRGGEGHLTSAYYVYVRRLG